VSELNTHLKISSDYVKLETYSPSTTQLIHKLPAPLAVQWS